MTTPPRRRWFQFGLGTLLAAIGVVAVLLVVVPKLRPDPQVAIKKAAIAEVTRQTGLPPEKLSAEVTRRDAEYDVLVWVLPAMPGGHYLLTFSEDGDLIDFIPGA